MFGWSYGVKQSIKPYLCFEVGESNAIRVALWSYFSHPPFGLVYGLFSLLRCRAQVMQM